MKKYPFLILLALLCLVVSVSGCVSSGNETNNTTSHYSQNGISFDYPGSWIFIVALIIPFLMVQKTLNSYWLKEQGDLPLKKVSGGEVLVLVIGILFVILDIILILML